MFELKQKVWKSGQNVVPPLKRTMKMKVARYFASWAGYAVHQGIANKHQLNCNAVDSLEQSGFCYVLTRCGTIFHVDYTRGPSVYDKERCDKVGATKVWAQLKATWCTGQDTGAIRPLYIRNDDYDSLLRIGNGDASQGVRKILARVLVDQLKF